jgi:hypothetical protein
MKSTVIFGFAALLALPAVSCAQDRRPATGQNSAERRPETSSPRHAVTEDRKSPDASGTSSRRLESVTWNSVKHELTWVISKGEKKGGASYKPLGSANYLINMDEATMNVSGETRRFSKEEAANVHVLMDLIAKYAVDSTVWWDDGQGEPVNGDGKGKHEPEKPRHRGRENDDVAILHVAAGPQRLATVAELQGRVRQLEKKLAEMRQLQRPWQGGIVRLVQRPCPAGAGNGQAWLLERVPGDRLLLASYPAESN